MTEKRTASNPPAARPDGGQPSGTDARKQAYVTPRLEYLGDIRDLTLGTTPGIGDSATDPANFQA
jgi:hypothetical protein